MSFLSDVKSIEASVRKDLEDGPVTPEYGLDRQEVYRVLNAALATEIVCILRYQQHYYMSTSIYQGTLQSLFKEHWEDEQEHADSLAERIKQLGGVPDFNPEGIMTRAASHFERGHTLADMLKEDLLAERVVIVVYNKMIEYFGERDVTTRRLLEHILQDEEDHADELADLLYTVAPDTGKTVEEFTGDGVPKPFKAN